MPTDRLNIIIEIPGSLIEVGEILVGQVLLQPPHVFFRKLNEVASDAITDTSRTAVEHDPYVVAFVEADLDEVVAGAQCSEMIHVIARRCARVLREDPLVPLLDSARRPERDRATDARRHDHRICPDWSGHVERLSRLPFAAS